MLALSMIITLAAMAAWVLHNGWMLRRPLPAPPRDQSRRRGAHFPRGSSAATGKPPVVLRYTTKRGGVTMLM